MSDTQEVALQSGRPDDDGRTSGGRGRTIAIVLGALVVLGIGAAVAAVLLLGGGSEEAAPKKPAAADELTPERSTALADALNARDPQRLASVIADPEVAADPAVAASAIREGETVTIDPTSFTRDGEVGFVEARIDGPEPSTLTFYLVDVDGEWKIAGSSQPQPAGTP